MKTMLGKVVSQSGVARQGVVRRGVTRRALLKGAASTGVASSLAAAFLPELLRPRLCFAQEAGRPAVPSRDELQAMSAIAQQFLTEYKSPGLSVAIAHSGEMVYQQGFGYADETGARVTPSHLFRIASVTKTITSTTIFSLIEQGLLGLDDIVFGPQGHLGDDYGANYPDDVNQITVHHLLTHTCGGWTNDGEDPMFSNPTMDHRELIAWTLQNKPLKNAPGTHYAYSNFGYCILGRLIEKLTGQPYIDYVEKNILADCDINAMRLATNERAENEVRYHGQNGENPYRANISRMDSHGGWLATASDLVKFAVHVDGFNNVPDILKPSSIQAMTTPTAANPNYACGWAVNQAPNWWHNGSLYGSTSLMVRTASGLCWAALANTRCTGIDFALDQMMWHMAIAVSDWKA